MESTTLIIAIICLLILVFSICSFAALVYIIYWTSKEDKSTLLPFPLGMMGMPHQHGKESESNGKKPAEGGNYI